MKTYLVIFGMIILQSTKAQELKKYQWENRLVLIFAENKFSKLLKDQIDLFEKNTAGLKERKLKIYQFSENDYKDTFDSDWKTSTIKTKEFFTIKEKFKVVLIGLDGGIKLTQKTILSTEKLFAIIDAMPMRKSELRQKGD